jgi:peptidoglycan/LPS O-acetylase OafA/YrhL
VTTVSERADQQIPSTTAPDSLRPRRKHFEFIDGIRAICALYVMVGHAWFEPANGYYPQRWISLLGFSYGHLAVVVFIVVSGFVITYPITQRGDQVGSLAGFYRRRIRRIVPPYYAALLLNCVFIFFWGHEKTGTIWDTVLPLTWGQIGAHAGMVNNLRLGIAGGSIGYQFWSVAVEFQIYLLTPFLILGVRKWGLPMLTVACTLLSALGAIYSPAFRFASGWFVALFLFGAGSARIVALRPALATRAGVVGLAISGASLLFTASRGNAWFHANEPWVDLSVGSGIALVIAGIAEGTLPVVRWLKRLLSFRPLVWIGTFSYSLYLVHTVLIHAAWLIWRRLTGAESTNMFALLLLTCPLIVLAARVFFTLFERPFMHASAPRNASA